MSIYNFFSINLISEKVIGSAYKVFGDTLGVGFLEKVYENALSVELKNRLKDQSTKAYKNLLLKFFSGRIFYRFISRRSSYCRTQMYRYFGIS